MKNKTTKIKIRLSDVYLREKLLELHNKHNDLAVDDIHPDHDKKNYLILEFEGNQKDIELERDEMDIISEGYELHFSTVEIGDL